MDAHVLLQFTPQTDPNTWLVVNDGVMGGLSQGAFAITEAGHGLFSGTVSLENNGGFTSVRHRFEPFEVSSYQSVVLRLRGDGKTYKFRIKSNQGEKHSYTLPFATTREWQTVSLTFEKMAPKFRGRYLDMPHYPGKIMSEIGFLIANKKKEGFRLEIDFIALR
ncbi:MAG: CIA30 family protein [Bacteroidota bacterium]